MINMTFHNRYEIFSKVSVFILKIREQKQNRSDKGQIE